MKPEQIYPIKSWQRIVLIIAGFIMIWMASFLVRTHCYNREADRINYAITGRESVKPSSCWLPLSRGQYVPFFIESAMMYAYAEDVAKGRGIPKSDPGLSGMGKIDTARQMSLGLEYFLGWGYRLKCLIFGKPDIKELDTTYEDNPDFAMWARFQLRLWASLCAGLIFLWLLVLRCPWYLAVVGGLIHVVSPAAIARYTGQDLLRGEFCLPLIITAFLLVAWNLRRPGPLKMLGTGLVVFAAFSFWDVCQLIFSLWVLVEIVRILIGGTVNAKRRNTWIMVYLGAAACGLFVPYQQTHQLLLSPLMVVLMPSLIAVNMFGGKSFLRRIVVLVIAVAALFGIWKISLSFGTYSGNYSHFYELVKAKIKFHNVKPSDPGKLNFDARILWTPALQSATVEYTRALFPFTLFGFAAVLLLNLLGYAAGGVTGLSGKAMYHRIKSFIAVGLVPLLLTLVFLRIYYYFVRYHVFCILFLCVALPLLTAEAYRIIGLLGDHISGMVKNGKTSLKYFIRGFTWIGLAVLLAGLLYLEKGMSLKYLGRKYPGQNMAETADLIKWMRRENICNRTVMADMVLSPQLKAYCRAAIVLQPKFELGETRKMVEDYINLMFHGTEKELADFCASHGAEFFIYDRGYSYAAAILHPYSNRYMANAIKSNKNSPAFMMYNKPHRLKWFYPLRPPAVLKFIEQRYMVFKVVSPEEREKAETMAKMALLMAVQGKKRLAAKLAAAAFLTDPASEKIYAAYFRITGRVPHANLRDFLKVKKNKSD